MPSDVENKNISSEKTVPEIKPNLTNKKYALSWFFLGLVIGLLIGGTGIYAITAKSVTQEKTPIPTVRPIVTSTPSISLTPTITTAEIKNGKNIWVNISEVRIVDTKTNLVIDYLENNPCWTPGGPPKPNCPNNHDFFLNKVEERIEVLLSSNAKAYNCTTDAEGNTNIGPDKDATSADTEIPLDKIVSQYQNLGDYYVDINNNEITSIYERCLP